MSRDVLEVMDDEMDMRGFVRVAIRNQDGSMHGDSGWFRNQITNEGFRNFTRLIGAISGSSAVTHAAIGTGTVPGAADTTLDGEQSVRAALTAATSNTSKAVLFTATFASSNNFVTATKNIANIGLFPVVTAATGTLIAGNTFASSSCATNQDVNVSYSLSFT